MYALGAPDENEHRLEHLYPEPLELGPWLHESEAAPAPGAAREGRRRDPRALALCPGALSYVTAPVICQEQAVGLVYADRGLTGEEVTELDRAALWAFVEGSDTPSSGACSRIACEPTRSASSPSRGRPRRA